MRGEGGEGGGIRVEWDVTSASRSFLTRPYNSPTLS